MFLLPIGLDESRVSRLPWVSISILAVCVVAWLGSLFAADWRGVERQYEATVEYWAERPYLAPPPALEERFGFDAEAQEERAADFQHRTAPPDATEEQARLDALAEELVERHDAIPERRYGLVPARGLAQVGWLTSLFMHGGFFHLLGNMIIFFLVVGPFLEDAWGRPFFLAFYLAGGLVAGAAQALPEWSSEIPIIGASGAISACLGAFALRFAHRRVRIFYWVFFFLRGSFLVPAWGYAIFAFLGDLMGLAGSPDGVAYGAHVGGFVFGLGTAIVLRASGLEARLTPEGAAQAGRTLAGTRAAEALHHGNRFAARQGFQEVLARTPDDPDALRGLLEIATADLDRAAVTTHLERLVVSRLAAGDAAGAREGLARHGALAEPDRWRATTALRAGELLAASEPGLADRFDEAAERGGGAVGAKALLRRAERVRAQHPARALELARRAEGLDGLPGELAARARELVKALEPARGAAPAATLAPAAVPAEAAPAPGGALPPGEAVRIVPCRLAALEGETLRLVTGAGKPAELVAARVAALAVGLVAELPAEGGPPARNRVVLDLLVHPREGERGRVLVRLLGHALPLSALHPGLPPQEAFGRVVDGLLSASGARAVPSPDAAAGRPLARFADLAAFEAAAWGRRLS